MKVIVAGYPKTGTKTMDAALRTLGYSVYGHTENIFRLEKEWTKILSVGASTDDFKKMYQDIDAVSDVPACFFWEEILRAFPDAKIIFMRRKDEDEWFESLENHIITFQKNFMIRILKSTSPTQWRIERNVSSPTMLMAVGYKHPAVCSNHVVINEMLAKKLYRSHNAHVLQNAPKDQLLIFNVTDGWELLCEFLGKPIPEEPFPRKNVRANISKEWVEVDPLLTRMQREMYFTLSVATILTFYISYKLIKHPPNPTKIKTFFMVAWNALKSFF